MIAVRGWSLRNDPKSGSGNRRDQRFRRAWLGSDSEPRVRRRDSEGYAAPNDTGGQGGEAVEDE